MTTVSTSDVAVNIYFSLQTKTSTNVPFQMYKQRQIIFSLRMELISHLQVLEWHLNPTLTLIPNELSRPIK